MAGPKSRCRAGGPLGANFKQKGQEEGGSGLIKLGRGSGRSISKGACSRNVRTVVKGSTNQKLKL